jgi:heme oxygenase
MILAAAPLALRLRLETRDLHHAAEHSGAMGALLRGELALPAYKAMLRNLLAIYQPLEAALDRHASHPGVAPMRVPALYRSKALSADLAALDPPGAGDMSNPEALEPAARDYALRLAGVAPGAAPMLVAHAYVRYLGDLHGGQTLSTLVGRAYGGQAAVGFYDFGDAEQLAAHRADFRASLAALPSTPEGDDLIVAEARWAFEQHILLFEQLMAHQGAG